MITKTKICHITTGHIAFDNRIFHKECKTLAASGEFDVALIAQHDNGGTIDGVRLLAISKSRGLLWKLTVTVAEALVKAVRHKADVYHFHDPEFIIAALVLGAVTGGKVIYDVHEDYEKQTRYRDDMPWWLTRAAAFLFKKIEKTVPRFFYGVMTATEDILQNFSFHKRAICIKNYPVVSYFNDRPQKLKSGNGQFNAVYIGGINKERGIFEMVRSLAAVDRKIKLTVYGRFESESCRKKIEATEGCEKVKFAGWKQHHEVVGNLSRFDAGLVCLHVKPNFLTSLPVKMFEYMAAGLPVVASNFPLWRQIIEKSGCGICVDPYDPMDIAHALEFLASNPEAASQMGQRGRRAIAEQYSWEGEKKKMLNFYRGIPLVNVSANTEKKVSIGSDLAHGGSDNDKAG